MMSSWLPLATPRRARWPPLRRSALLQRSLFHSFGLSADAVERLARLGLSQPTPAQQQAIPAILRGEDVVIAAETGGGKTLAYLLPVLQRLEQHPLPLDRVRLPVALVLTSSADLVRQIAAVLHQVKPELAESAVALSSTQQKLGERRRRPTPIVVATPRALMRASSPRDFAFTEVVVVDEADMLLSGGFEKDTKQLLATIRNQPVLRPELNEVDDDRQRPAPTDSEDGEDNEEEDDDDDRIRPEDVTERRTQTVFSAISFPLVLLPGGHATIPDYGKRSVRGFIEHKFPAAQFAVTQDFHRTLPRLVVEWRDLDAFVANNNMDADPALARCELLYEILTTNESSDARGNTLVFANSVASANALFDFLRGDKQLPNCALYHKEVPSAERREVLRLLDDASANVTVVCTDIAARGLDTTKVGHVVQFEFANDVVSYLHRIGRTARAGASGRVTNVVSAENELVLAKIREAGGASLGGAFSRKRSLRKKFKKAKRDASDGDSN